MPVKIPKSLAYLAFTVNGTNYESGTWWFPTFIIRTTL